MEKHEGETLNEENKKTAKQTNRQKYGIKNYIEKNLKMKLKIK